MISNMLFLRSERGIDNLSEKFLTNNCRSRWKFGCWWAMFHLSALKGISPAALGCSFSISLQWRKANLHKINKVQPKRAILLCFCTSRDKYIDRRYSGMFLCDQTNITLKWLRLPRTPCFERKISNSNFAAAGEMSDAIELSRVYLSRT